ncbi:MAG TPA: cation-translocating P-type ATPase [Thiotrichales bacterium]|nr:MAG: cation-translocating P-type ATPase [Thiotrichales bacterium]HQT02966.1 cation-translocating P-type ATPase [Thiotrichales bacterium]HQT05187.1 cation-translocating P-type ATPase [Thiotrichales bacterium]
MNTYQGLTQQQAELRLKQAGENVLPSHQPKGWVTLVFNVISEPLFLLLLVAGMLYLLLGSQSESVFLLGFLFLVIGVTLIQTSKTERALAALRDLSAPRALVIRDGIEKRILGREVVCDDIVILREGDRVVADALILEGQITLDESLLTGESVPVLKTFRSEKDICEAPDSQAVYASTLVTKGLAIARVTAIGPSTFVGKIGTALAQPHDDRSLLQKSTHRMIRNLTILAVLLVTLQVLLSALWNHQGWLESLLAGIALAMAVLPEELSVILTVFLALGAWRLSQKNVLTRRLSAVEALGGISVLAVDKTGTLTCNQMQVAELAQGDAVFCQRDATILPESFHTLVEYAMLATPQDPFDPMEKAIQVFGHQWLSGTEHVHDTSVVAFDYALSPDILAMTRVFSVDDKSNEFVLATKGSPEAVIDLCHLSVEESTKIHQQVERMAKQGLRVLGVARGVWFGEVLPTNQHDFDFEFLGLIGLIDPPREHISQAIAECQQAGIRVIMMTGDHPVTACAIASQIGLADQDAQVLTGADMSALSDHELCSRLQTVTVCARLQPEHKLRLIHMLQQSGHVVAMTGDGVNDAPALRAADVGIAMGQRGTDVAREAAALVLLDDSFNSIVTAVRQGRRIYDNIDNVTRFIFAVHIVIILLVLVPSALQWVILLLPVHIVLLQLVIDPACSIVFEAEADAKDIMSRPPRSVKASPFARENLIHALSQGVGVALILLLAHHEMLLQGMLDSEVREVIFVALVLGVFLLIVANRNLSQSISQNLFDRRNAWLLGLLVGVISLLIVVFNFAFLGDVMKFAGFTPDQLLTVLVLLVLMAIWLELIRYARHLLVNPVQSVS